MDIHAMKVDCHRNLLTAWCVMFARLENAYALLNVKFHKVYYELMF